MKDKEIGCMDIKTKEEKIMVCKALSKEICQQIFDFLGIDSKIDIDDIKLDDKEKN